jgi:hypothetical protein
MATTKVKIQTRSGLLIFDASCVSDILYVSYVKYVFGVLCVSYLFVVSYVSYVLGVSYGLDVSYVLDVLKQIVFFHRTEEACVFYLLQNE